MAINKIQTSEGGVLIDLTQDTVSASDVMEGKTFHLKTGEVGTGTFAVQEKTVEPTTSAQNIVPDTGYSGLTQVTVNAIQTEEKTAYANGDVVPSQGKYLTKVIVDVEQSGGNNPIIATTQEEFDALLADAHNDGKYVELNNNTYKLRLSTLKNLPMGSKIKVPHSVMGDIVFLKADQNHEGYPENSTTLITEKAIVYQPFDAKESTSNSSSYQQYGNSDYTVSNIRQWLNSSAEAGQWYSAQHTYDAPPSIANVYDGKNAYDQDAGFLYGFESSFVDSIQDTSFKTYTGSGYVTITDKIFLPSPTELLSTSQTESYYQQEGLQLELFSDNDKAKIITYPSEYAVSKSESTLGVDTATGYWVRTRGSISGYVKCFVASGSTSGGLKAYGSCGIRPLCNLDSGAYVSPIVDTDGCYTIVFDPTIYNQNIEYYSSEKMQQKSVTPSAEPQSVLPDSEYKALSEVTVNATPTETQTVAPSTTTQTITPGAGKFLSQVTVNPIIASLVPNLYAKNIKKGVSILGITGVYETITDGVTITYGGYVDAVSEAGGPIIDGEIIAKGTNVTVDYGYFNSYGAQTVLYVNDVQVDSVYGNTTSFTIENVQEDINIFADFLG